MGVPPRPLHSHHHVFYSASCRAGKERPGPGEVGRGWQDLVQHQQRDDQPDPRPDRRSPAALLGLPLLALLFQPAETTGSGYGAPAAEYGAPSSSYGSPSYSRSDEGYEEFRAFFTGLLDSDPAAPSSELSKRMQEIAQPLVVKLGDAAAKLIQ